MTAQQNLIDDLEDAIATKNIGRRAALLRSVADLFLSGSATLSGEQIALFDDVMGRLMHEIDSSARAAFGQRLGAAPNAPPNILRALALDDAIEVSGPILAQSEQLSEATVVEAATTRSQDHLLAISCRSSLPEVVTDVLVERGNQQVALSTAANKGARFSEHGYSTLVKRAETDDSLALCVWSRPEVPRQHLLKMFSDASEAVRQELCAAEPGKGQLFNDMVAQASNKIQANARERSPEYAAAFAKIKSLHDARELGETQLAAFANDGQFDETTIALALMCDLPIALTERLMAGDGAEQTIVIARAFGFTWETAKAMLVFQGGSSHELARRQATFAKLKPDTAKKAIGFYRMREQAAAHVDDSVKDSH